MFDVLLKQIIRGAEYFMCPTFCLICKQCIQHGLVVCPPCRGRIRPVASIIHKLSRNITMPVCAITAYEDPFKRLIMAKQMKNIAVAKSLGKLLWQMSAVQTWDFDIVVPIPLHWTRYAWRGYNQAEEIASVIAQNSGKPLVHALVRTKKTVSQTTLSHDERVQNVADVFVLTLAAEKLHGARVLLIDDVLTSGSTLGAAGSVLLQGHPVNVCAAVICRVV